MKKKRTASRILKYLVLVIIMLFLMFPLYWVILTSFKSNMEAYMYPPTMIAKNPSVQSYVVTAD